MTLSSKVTFKGMFGVQDEFSTIGRICGSLHITAEDFDSSLSL